MERSIWNNRRKVDAQSVAEGFLTGSPKPENSRDLIGLYSPDIIVCGNVEDRTLLASFGVPVTEAGNRGRPVVDTNTRTIRLNDNLIKPIPAFTAEIIDRTEDGLRIRFKKNYSEDGSTIELNLDFKSTEEEFRLEVQRMLRELRTVYDRDLRGESGASQDFQKLPCEVFIYRANDKRGLITADTNILSNYRIMGGENVVGVVIAFDLESIKDRLTPEFRKQVEEAIQRAHTRRRAGSSDAPIQVEDSYGNVISLQKVGSDRWKLMVHLRPQQSENGGVSYGFDLSYIGIRAKNDCFLRSTGYSVRPLGQGATLLAGPEVSERAVNGIKGAVEDFEKMFGVPFTGSITFENSLPNQASHAGLILKSPLDQRIIHHELGHWLHFNDPGVCANLNRFYTVLDQQFSKYGLSRSDQRLFYELMEEGYSQGRYYFRTRDGAYVYIPEQFRGHWAVAGGDPTIETEASGHLRSGAHEVFASMTSILLNDENAFREFVFKVSTSTNLSDDIQRHLRMIGVVNRDNIIFSTLIKTLREANKLTPVIFLDILKNLLQEYRAILAHSENIPPSAPIFQRIDRFIGIVDQAQNSALGYRIR